MVYPIVIYGHPLLRRVAEDVEKDYPGLQQLIADMFETMYKAEGMGLAAPQIGKSLRIVVIDGKPLGEDEPELADFKKVFINAHVVKRYGDQKPMTEGCLSIPGVTVDTRRALSVVAKGQNKWGEPVVLEGTELLARCVQHETDHLDGILFVDRLDPAARKAAMRAIREAEWFADNPPEVRISPHSTFGLGM